MIRRRIVAVLSIVVIGGTAALSASPAQAGSTTPEGGPTTNVAGDGWSRIVNDHSDLALQGRTSANGVAVWQVVRDPINILSQPIAGQDWLMQRDGSYYRFRNAGTTGWLALTVNSNVAGTGKPIIQWTNTAGNGDQLWDMKPVSGGTLYTYTLRNPKSNKCLAIPASSTATGVQAIVWPCQANNHDQWWWIHDIN